MQTVLSDKDQLLWQEFVAEIRIYQHNIDFFKYIKILIERMLTLLDNTKYYSLFSAYLISSKRNITS